MLSVGEIEAVLKGGHELRGIEVKGPGVGSDGRLFSKVTRACISMGNHSDGGHVIIGIDDSDLPGMTPGLKPDALADWLDFDTVSSRMAEYVDPPLRFHVDTRQLANGSVVAVLEISEFADLPHLCIKDYSGVLRRGALYVRTRKMPETAEIASVDEMRELLDLATVKRLRSYVTIAERAGIDLVDGQSAEDPFKAERDRAWDD
jgi:predicted HTH transcriptional regulator